MVVAKENNLSSIAFPAVSTGVYGYPKEEACDVALTTALDFMKETGYTPEIIFVLFDEDNYRLYRKQLEEMNK
jgi:O-acetyl-ADP-ribose deacetylase (regulator of RNase III)